MKPLLAEGRTRRTWRRRGTSFGQRIAVGSADSETRSINAGAREHGRASLHKPICQSPPETSPYVQPMSAINYDNARRERQSDKTDTQLARAKVGPAASTPPAVEPIMSVLFTHRGSRCARHQAVCGLCQQLTERLKPRLTLRREIPSPTRSRPRPSSRAQAIRQCDSAVNRDAQ